MAARNGWNSYQKLVLSQLAEHSESLGSLNRELKELRTMDIPTLQVEIAMLKIKAGLWGAAAGAIPSVAALVYIYLQG